MERRNFLQTKERRNFLQKNIISYFLRVLFTVKASEFTTDIIYKIDKSLNMLNNKRYFDLFIKI